MLSTMPSESSKLSKIFYIFAALSLVGGLTLTAIFLPGDPGYGMSWKMIAYTPSITAFTIGFLQASIFTAIGQVLNYLKEIERNTRR